MSEPPSYPGAPRWLKALGIVILVLVALFGVLRLVGHDPMAHHGAHLPASTPR